MTWYFASCSRNFENNELHTKLPTIVWNWKQEISLFVAAISNFCIEQLFSMLILFYFFFHFQINGNSVSNVRFFLFLSSLFRLNFNNHISISAQALILFFLLENKRGKADIFRTKLFLNEFRAHVFEIVVKMLKITCMCVFFFKLPTQNF